MPYDARQFIAGCFSALVGVFIRTPFEVIKCRQQLCVERFLPTYEVMKVLIRERKVYCGLPATLIRDVFPGGLYFWCYFKLKRVLLDQNANVAIHTLNRFLIGSLAGIISWIVIYPIDVIRNFQQSSKGQGNVSIREAYKMIKQKYGCGAMLKGLDVTLARTSVSSGISLLLFDTFLNCFNANYVI